MRIGFNLMMWTMAPEYEAMAPVINRLAELGYEAVEIPVHDIPARDMEKFSSLARQLGMELQAIDLVTADEGDMISHDAALRRAAVKRYQESIHRARDIGAKVLSGPFFQGLCAPPTRLGPVREEWAWAVEGLRCLAEEAMACGGILLAAEPLNRFEMHIVNRLDQADTLCSQTGMQNLGLLADTHHANIEELDVTETFTKYAKRIFNVHISENNRGIPGAGHGIPATLIRSMLDAGYEGNFVVEAFNCEHGEVLPMLRIWEPLAPSKDEICQKSIAFIKSCL